VRVFSGLKRGRLVSVRFSVSLCTYGFESIHNTLSRISYERCAMRRIEAPSGGVRACWNEDARGRSLAVSTRPPRLHNYLSAARGRSAHHPSAQHNVAGASSSYSCHIENPYVSDLASVILRSVPDVCNHGAQHSATALIVTWHGG
jgi:hypothetical protein